jgi:hypothetical protein
MSDMAETTLFGVPLTKDFPFELDSAVKKETKERKAELEEFGVTVTGIHMLGEGAPPRFFIEFPKGVPSYKIRGMLESKQYDIGQQMGSKMLRFYAARRVVRGEGWEV